MIRHPALYLTDNYKTDAESGNYKLLSLGHSEHLEILEALNSIEASRDIDEAFGFTLDKAGKNVLELRRGRGDEAFRQAIKIKILNNLSAGTIDELNAICDILFGEHFDGISETWHMPEFGFEPAGIVLSVKENPDLQMVFYDFIRALIKAAKSGGVRLGYRQISKDIDAEIHFGTVVSETSRALVSLSPLSDMGFSSVGHLCAFVTEAVVQTIPTKVLSNARITTAAFLRTTVFEYEYRAIPTAVLREGTE